MNPGEQIGDKESGDFLYEWSGPADGLVVVMVNPFSVPLCVWERNIDALTRGGHRVLRSLAAPTPIDIAGVSMGAEIAAAFAARYPERVRKLCMVDPPATETTWKTIFPMNIRGVGEFLMTVYVIPSILSSPNGDFHRPGSVPDWGTRFREQTEYRGFRRALLSTMRNLPSNYLDVYSRVGGMGKPVLLIWGENDTSMPISNLPRSSMPFPRLKRTSFLVRGISPTMSAPTW